MDDSTSLNGAPHGRIRFEMHGNFDRTASQLEDSLSSFVSCYTCCSWHFLNHR